MQRKTEVNRAAIVLSMCVLLADRPLLSATYHVAQSDPTASDGNPDTSELPWKSISKAAETLHPGDTVIIHAGLYREHVRPAHSGTSSQPITYEAVEGDEVVITGADVVDGWSKAEGNVWKKSSWPYRFPTHPDDVQHRLIGRCEQVIVDERPLTQVATVSDVR